MFSCFKALSKTRAFSLYGLIFIVGDKGVEKIKDFKSIKPILKESINTRFEKQDSPLLSVSM